MKMEGNKLPNLQLVVFIQCKKNHAANQSTMEANRVKIVSSTIAVRALKACRKGAPYPFPFHNEVKNCKECSRNKFLVLISAISITYNNLYIF